MCFRAAGISLLLLVSAASALRLHTSSLSHLNQWPLHFDAAPAAPAAAAPSKSQLAAFKMQFDSMDSNNNSRLEPSEMLAFMKQFVPQFTLEHAKMAIKQADLDNSGDNDFDEYVKQIFAPPPPPPNPQQMARMQFDSYDDNHDGKITFTEFKKKVMAEGIKASDEDHKRMFGRYDLDHDGEITFKEFAQ